MWGGEYSGVAVWVGGGAETGSMSSTSGMSRCGVRNIRVLLSGLVNIWGAAYLRQCIFGDVNIFWRCVSFLGV